ncbi:MAG: hypothetical protein ACAH07_05985 [Methylophilaceae bacterium]|nr:hypothetical protein [Methyloradius sp.]
MQSSIFVGDSLIFTDAVADYPASAGWTLKYRFVGPTGGAAYLVTATAQGDDYLVSAAPAVTSLWVPGNYAWSKWVEKAAQRFTLDAGQIVFMPDPSAMTVGTDTRSHLQKTIANIEAMIEGKTSQDVQEYTISGGGVDRQLKKIPLPELIVLLEKYKAQLAAETAGTKPIGGRGRKLFVRF